MFGLLGTFITLDSGFATNTLSYAGTIVSDLSTFLTLIIGVLITVLIVVSLIRAFHK